MVMQKKFVTNMQKVNDKLLSGYIMKNIKYKSFSFFFNLFKRLFKPKNSNITFITIHKDHFRDNLGFVHEELKKRNPEFNYTFIYKEEYSLGEVNSLTSFLKKILELVRFYLFKSYKMATSHYIFLNDNFLPMAYMNFDQNNVVIQLWHGAGAFKKFGLSSTTDLDLIELERLIAKKLDYVVVSSKKIAPFYEEAFGVNSNKILALGVPSTDYYFIEHDLNNLRRKFEKLYPESKNKKLILYAPTFRENKKLDENLIENLNIELFNKELGQNYILAIRLHPQVNNKESLNNKHILDLTDYPDSKELLLLADILITDYSSIMVEYALLNKPLIFYPFDYDYYVNKERGFYFDYNKVPGKIAINSSEIISIIKNNEFDFNKTNEFVFSQYDHLDGNSSQRLVSYLLKNK